MEANSNGMKPPVLANIRAEWDWVKEGVEEIKGITDKLTWRPEDVYASCLSGESALWVSDRDWFVVTTITVDPFNGDRSLLVWLLWSKERGKKIASQVSDFCESIARQSGCRSVEAKTSEKKLSDYYESVGYKVNHIVLQKCL